MSTDSEMEISIDGEPRAWTDYWPIQRRAFMACYAIAVFFVKLAGFIVNGRWPALTSWTHMEAARATPPAQPSDAQGSAQPAERGEG